jgi:GT2 family glycosyltransferase
MSTRETEYPTISIIVLNYNSLMHLRDCLDSLLRLDYRPDRLEVLLADNASSDRSVEWVTAHYPIVRIVQNGSNLGFAGGNNAAAKAARGDWVAFLNPDTRVEPNWLSELIQPALRDPDIVCVASKMLTWDGAAIDFADAAINFMGWGCQPGFGSRDLSQADREKDLLFACGGALLIERQTFLDAGGFDADYFAYFEDVDLGWRLWLQGQRVAYAPRAVVYHRHHGSWESVSDLKRWRLAERNTLFTAIKNYDDDSLARVLPAALLLLVQRAYLDVRPDPAVFGDRLGAGRVYGVRYYLDQLWGLLRRGRFDQVWARTRAELQRRTARRASRSAPAVVPASSCRYPDGAMARPAAGAIDLPAIALSRLAAGRAVRRAWGELQVKRAALQDQRMRRDCEIFPLFQWALVSNFGDEAFIRAMQVAIARFGLRDLFEAPAAQPLDRAVRELSARVSRQLLAVIDRAFVLSGVAEDRFQVGGPAPEEHYHVPVVCVSMLADLHRALWTLPDAPLPDVLTSLAATCDKILRPV